MDKPIESNGYKKYIIQVGWFNPQPNLLFAVLAQEVLTKSKKDGEYLMKLLYPESLGVGLPYLCPIIEEIENNEDEDEESLIDKWLNEDRTKKIDLIYPN